MKLIIFQSFVTVILLTAGASAPFAQVAAGGGFTLEKSVVATGGGASANGALAVAGTSGQPAAKPNSSSPPFSQAAGFWTPDALAPTAAGVTVEGRVTTADGRGIRNARVTMTGADGFSRSVVTGSFGYFRLTEVPSGDIYLLGVSARRFTFSAPTQVISVVDNVTGLTFVADAVP